VLLASGGDLDDAGLFADVQELCARLGPGYAADIRQALTQITARILEMRLLSDEVLREVSRLPDVYLARSEEIVRGRISALGLQEVLDEEDIRYVARLLVSGGALRAASEGVGEELVSSLFRERRLRGTVELRCAICGFHFRRQDLSAERAALSDQFDLVFAGALLPERRRDLLKPPEKTALHIDHVVPRLGLGPTRLDNLQVLCAFCNAGKLAYRRSLESVPAVIAGSVPPLDSIPPAFARRSAVVGALMRQRQCGVCGALPTVRELSVATTVAWFTPWTLRVRCYACFEG
jgi:HNH endonuclease